jgi:hypothetical protein
VVINEWNPLQGQFKYELRMNSSDSATPSINPILDEWLIGVNMYDIDMYRTKGFMDLQHFLDQTICM